MPSLTANIFLWQQLTEQAFARRQVVCASVYLMNVYALILLQQVAWMKSSLVLKI